MAGSWSNTATSLIILVEQISGYSGIFGYSPAPGAGTLVFSLSAAAGTDPYGNAYPQGLSIGSETTRQIVLNYDGTRALMTFSANNGHGATSGTILEAIIRSGLVNEYLSLQVDGPAVINHTDSMQLQLNSQNLDGTSDANAGMYHSAAGLLMSWDPTQIAAEVPLKAYQLGQVTDWWVKQDASGAALTWQTPSFSGTWSSTGTLNGNAGFRGLQYRKDAEDNVWILGAATTTGAGGSIFTLPAAYTNAAKRHLLPCYIFDSSAAAVVSGFVQVTEAGVVNISATLAGVTIAAGDQVFVNGKFPLGNIS